MYEKILIPIDNSPGSSLALSWGIGLAKRFKSRLTGIHIYNAQFHEFAFKRMEEGLPDPWRDEEVLKEQRMIHDALITKGLQLIADSFLQVFNERCAGEGVDYESRMLEGKNFEEILKEAKKDGYGLVALGAYGIGRTDLKIVGSVCERVARYLNKDLLVAKERFPKSEGRILVAVDGSRNSFHALRKGLILAKSLGVDIKAVAVFDPLFHKRAFANISRVLTEEAAEVFKFEQQKKLHEDIIDTGLKAVAEAHLRKAQQIAKIEGVNLPTEVLEGKPYREILRSIEREKPFLLITGRYGTHKSDMTHIGSHAENLLRLSPVSHLIVEDAPWEVDWLQTPVEEETPLKWDIRARALLERVPHFAMGMAKKAVEREARARGMTEVTEELIREVRAKWEGKPKPLGGPPKGPIQWTEEALKKMERVPEFCRDMAKFRVEVFAAKRGYDLITEEVLEERYTRWGKEAGEVDFDESLWTEEAKERIEKIPEDIRRSVIKEIEGHARRNGITRITGEVLEEVKRKWQDWESYHETHKEF